MFSYELKRRLVIKMDQQLVYAVELNSPSIVIDRPSEYSREVQQILPGVKFLLEWIGEGDFNRSAGSWALYDIRNDQNIDKKLLEGRLISEERPIQFGPLQVRIESYLLILEVADESMMLAA
jgi:hypothetical protein